MMDLRMCLHSRGMIAACRGAPQLPSSLSYSNEKLCEIQVPECVAKSPVVLHSPRCSLRSEGMVTIVT